MRTESNIPLETDGIAQGATMREGTGVRQSAAEVSRNPQVIEAYMGASADAELQGAH